MSLGWGKAGSNTLVAWRGPSRFDGKPIMVSIAAGPSTNAKTGNMIQVYVTGTDKPPFGAVHDGDDYSVCGCCALRPKGDGPGGCYVPTVKLRSHWDAAMRKEVASTEEIRVAFGYRPVRLGAYGDMAAVPAKVTNGLVALAQGKVTNYTHGWKTLPWSALAHMKPYTMASVETVEEMRDAWSRGWRTYRMVPHGGSKVSGEIVCPYETAGTQCYTCLRCGGHGLKGPSIVITVHGGDGVEGKATRAIRGEK